MGVYFGGFVNGDFEDGVKHQFRSFEIEPKSMLRSTHSIGIALLFQVVLVFTICGCDSGNKPKTTKEIVSQPKRPNPDFPSLDSLKKCSPDELRIIRNTLFAKYGYIFKSDDLKQHFSQLKWYKPEFADQDTVLNMFSELDKTRLGIVKEYERQLQKRSIHISNLSFEDYLNTLPFIDLPWTFECDGRFDRVEQEWNAPLVSKFNPHKLTMLGRLYQNDSIVLMVYGYAADGLIPVAETRLLNGVKLGEHVLLQGCGQDVDYFGHGVSEISEDLKLTITMTDIDCRQKDSLGCDTIIDIEETQLLPIELLK